MSGGLLILTLGLSSGSLQVEAESPQSLCPPEEEAAQAIADRVGKVKGAEYLVRYGLIQDATLQSTILRIVLLRDNDAVLEREIRVDETDCPHLASVIALIVAGYFEQQHTNRPSAEPEDAPREEEERQSSPPLPAPRLDDTSAPAQHSNDHAQREGPSSSDSSSSQRPFLLRWGAGVGSTPWGASLLLGARWNSTPWIHFQFDLLLRPALAVLKETPYELEVIRQEAHLGVGIHSASFAGFSFGLTPLVGAAIESVRLTGDVGEGHGPKLRAVGVFGCAGSAQWAFAPRWVLGVSTRFRILAGGRPFLVNQGEGTYDQLLSFPEYLTDFSLYLGVTL